MCSVAAGVDAIGFVFAESVRRISVEHAAHIAAVVPPFVAIVAVFRNPSVDDIRAVLRIDRLTLMQSDEADAAIFAKAGCRVSLLPVIRIGASVPVADSRGPCLIEGLRSGVGERVDWTQVAPIASERSVILAGGLTPRNVAEAIAAVRPYGVDVSSGVESEPGIKDPRLIEGFVRAVRWADSQMEIEDEQGDDKERA